MTSLSGTVVNITFLSDGTAIDAAGNYANQALFFYNNVVPEPDSIRSFRSRSRRQNQSVEVQHQCKQIR